MVQNCDRGFKNAARRRKLHLTNFTRFNYFVIFRNNFKCKIIVSFVEFTPNFARGVTFSRALLKDDNSLSPPHPKTVLSVLIGRHVVVVNENFCSLRCLYSY